MWLMPPTTGSKIAVTAVGAIIWPVNCYVLLVVYVAVVAVNGMKGPHAAAIRAAIFTHLDTYFVYC